MTVFRTQGVFTTPPAWAYDAGMGTVAPGTTGPTAAVLEPNAPPSSYAVAAAIDGEQGAILRLVGLTFLRGCFIFPGLWVVNKITKAELDALKLLALSFGGSATITLGMVAYYLVQRRVLQWRSQTALPVV